MNFSRLQRDEMHLFKSSCRDRDNKSGMVKSLVVTPLLAFRVVIYVEITTFHVGMDFGGTGGLTIKA